MHRNIQNGESILTYFRIVVRLEFGDVGVKVRHLNLGLFHFGDEDLDLLLVVLLILLEAVVEASLSIVF